jgi:flagellar assembly protein FliH
VRERKYFFDLNNFDELEVIEPETEAPPPPPTFSLDEIGNAKEISYEEGRMAGLSEAETSRGQYIAHQVNHIAQSIAQLATSESYRNAQFEREVLSVTHSIFETLFPSLTHAHAIHEIKRTINEVISREINTAHIMIEVPIDDAEEIQNYIDQARLDEKLTITVKGDPNLLRGNCRILWKDGGAIRDHNAVTREILRQLKPTTESNDPSSRSPLAQVSENDHNNPDQTISDDNEGDS